MNEIEVNLKFKYKVKDPEIAKKRLEGDRQMFESMEKAFWAWEGKAGEERMPEAFDCKIELTESKKEEEDEVSSVKSEGGL